MDPHEISKHLLLADTRNLKILHLQIIPFNGLRLYRISPTLFGKYPKQFDKLFKNISSYQKEDEEEIKSTLWNAYQFGDYYHNGQKRKSGKTLLQSLLSSC